MHRGEYKKLGPSEYANTVDGELKASKPNGSTHLDLGGDTEVRVKENDGYTLIEFKADDGTRGELTIPIEAFE
ncbi:hypothetical protein [Natrinema sp. DC36]|uniref:hypothetical protein n=1 Tax=Natrinema sp. DC36 TaxID=2878680 RepID=UPI001CF046E5|nr:hypothetical protein [Natrinema sp. DC36]